MACVLVAAAEAVGVTVAVQIMKHKERKRKISLSGDENTTVESRAEGKLPFYKKLQWLANLLWGGVLLLAFEHLWHGELVPWFPFLTAMNDPADTTAMLHEMATVGVTMSLLVTAVWGIGVAVYTYFEKKRIADKAVTVKE
ncbi:MAG: hypothetical protein ILP02_00310 [Clostridia bacterium]|nr:hypothetical protein [Clostridia bacterium]